MKKRSFLSATVVLAAALVASAPSLANSGDLPAPVDSADMDGPGQSHTNDSGISGFDGNQGNDRMVGNAGGRPLPDPIEEPVEEEPVDDGYLGTY